MKLAVLAVVAVLVGLAANYALRGYRVGRVSLDFISNLRYQVESGESVADTPAGDALAVGYLETIFSDNQELLGRLKGVVQRGLEDDQALKLGEVSAMVVTYSKDDEDNVSDVVAHVLGGFPMRDWKPGFNKDGYFRHLIDRNIWSLGNAVIGLLGRDMIMFAEESVAESQQNMLDALFLEGNVMPLAERIRKSMYYTAVFPNPKKLLPLQLRHHVQALVIKGFLSPEKGRTEVVMICPSLKSANYTTRIMADMKAIGEVLLRTKWNGVETTTAWGAQWVDTWWAYEMVQASENTEFTKNINIIRARTEFSRVMVNAWLKSVERMGRDLAQARGWREEKIDPRRVDRRLRSRSPQHYWSQTHRWGPNWPFAAPEDTNITVQVLAEIDPVAPADGETAPSADLASAP